MRTNILLAIDVPIVNPWYVNAAADMVRELIRDERDHVTVLHVREFSIARLARNMLDHGGASGRRAVDEIVAGLRAAGVHASGLIREADFGHVARAILDAADEFNARVIVLGSRGRTDLPHVPGAGVATHVLHMATLPVMIVPQIDASPSPVPSRS